jgi:hypothetical protein
MIRIEALQQAEAGESPEAWTGTWASQARSFMTGWRNTAKVV